VHTCFIYTRAYWGGGTENVVVTLKPPRHSADIEIKKLLSPLETEEDGKEADESFSAAPSTGEKNRVSFRQHCDCNNNN